MMPRVVGGGGVFFFIHVSIWRIVTVHGFSSTRTSTVPVLPFARPTALSVRQVREADMVEQLVGGVRYSLVPMPELMKATTAYVGNLCEFVNDQDLSDLFAQVSTLLSIPSCVVRKPDFTSLQYGFVSFPSETEKIVSRPPRENGAPTNVTALFICHSYTARHHTV
jgi:RNA recognition motif. (a.k.a. RRM, RBD, or RNP domain)